MMGIPETYFGDCRLVLFSLIFLVFCKLIRFPVMVSKIDELYCSAIYLGCFFFAECISGTDHDEQMSEPKPHHVNSDGNQHGEWKGLDKASIRQLV